jgi:hypothetical protein
MPRPTQKFAIFDPSIIGEGGHYFEYARRIIIAASQSGLTDLTIAVNNAANVPPDPKDRFQIVPAFTYDIWGNAVGETHVIDPKVDALAKRLWVSRLAMLWELAGAPPEQIERFENTGLRRVTARRLQQIKDLRDQIPAEFHHLAYEDFPRFLSLMKSVLGSSTKPFANNSLEKVHIAETRANIICRELRAAIEDIGLGADDVVFLPSASMHDARGLEQLMREDGTANLPVFVLLYRRNIFDCFPETYKENLFETYGERLSLQRLIGAGKDVDGDVKIRFCTDTAELSEQYFELIDSEVPHVAIPVPAAVEEDGRAKDTNAPLRLLYLGDAREEKGFWAVARLAALTRDHGFASNFRVRTQLYHSLLLREAATLTQVQMVKSVSSDGFSIAEGILDDEQYFGEIANSDVVLICYDRNQYAARSSGIFIEALHRNKPVVAPAGSWMGREINDLTTRYHGIQLANSPAISTLHGPELKWEIQGDKTTIPDPQNIILYNYDILFSIFDVPKDANYMRVKFKAARGQLASAVQLTFAQRGFLKKKLGGADIRVTYARDENSVLIALAPGIKSVKMCLQNCFSDKPTSVEGLTLEFFKLDGNLAEECGGSTYVQETLRDSTFGNIRASLDRLSNNRAAVKTATQFAGDLTRDYHTPENLFNQLQTIAQDGTGEPN